MKALSRDDLTQLVQAANIKTRLKRELRFVPEEVNSWEDRDFLAVMTKSGREGVLLIPFGVSKVVPFQLERRVPNYLGRVEAIICDICATWQRGTHSAVISFSTEKGSTSYLCCGDLLCSLHVRDKTAASILSRTQLREHIALEERIERLKKKLNYILTT